jgi:hypothetical protein
LTLDKTSGNQITHVKQKWHQRQTLRRKWLLQLSRPLTKGGERLNSEDKSLGERSVLSGITMEELQAQTAKPLNLNQVWVAALIKRLRADPSYSYNGGIDRVVFNDQVIQETPPDDGSQECGLDSDMESEIEIIL